MPKFYYWIADTISRSRTAMIVLIIIAGVGIPAWAVFENELGQKGQGLIVICWVLILTTIWFRRSRRSEALWTGSVGVDHWISALVLDIFLIAGVMVLLA